MRHTRPPFYAHIYAQANILAYSSTAIMFALRQSIRTASTLPIRSTAVLRPCTHLVQTPRTFRSTSTARADMSDMAEAFAKSPLFDVMKNSPGAVAALKEAGEIAKKKGESGMQG